MSRNEKEPKCVSCEEAKVKAQSNKSSAVASGYVHSKCQNFYADVERCMKKHNGNVSPCQTEWQKFQACHTGTREERLS